MLSNWQMRLNDSEAVFRRPMTDRVGIGALGLSILGILLAAGPTLWHTDALWELIAMLLVVFLVFGFASGPKEIRFDFNKRTYQTRSGLFCFSWRRRGSMEEIKSIRAYTALRFVGVGISWKHSFRDSTLFAGCSSESEAKTLAQTLATQMGLPVDEYPAAK